jgi:hypothetical protein
MDDTVNDNLYAAALPLIEERGNQIIFGGDPDATWAANEEIGDTARPVEASRLVIDRRFWLLLGKPDVLVCGFANDAGWDKWVGVAPDAKARTWLEGFAG